MALSSIALLIHFVRAKLASKVIDVVVFVFGHFRMGLKFNTEKMLWEQTTMHTFSFIS